MVSGGDMPDERMFEGQSGGGLEISSHGGLGTTLGRCFCHASRLGIPALDWLPPSHQAVERKSFVLGPHKLHRSRFTCHEDEC